MLQQLIRFPKFAECTEFLFHLVKTPLKGTLKVRLTFLPTDRSRGVVVVVALANNDLDPASYSTVILFARNLDDVIFGFDGGSDVISDLSFQHTIRPVV